jgi:hypothetical protein
VWKATALSKLDPSRIDDVGDWLVVQLCTLINRFISDINSRGVITVIQTSVIWMITKVCTCISLPARIYTSSAEGEYYDLSLIPERYTGYSGPDSARVWRSIYQENCFGLTEQSITPGKVSSGLADGLREDAENSDTCLEKRVYYRIISGLHASISTHICLDFLNKATGDWVSFQVRIIYEFCEAHLDIVTQSPMFCDSHSILSGETAKHVLQRRPSSTCRSTLSTLSLIIRLLLRPSLA